MIPIFTNKLNSCHFVFIFPKWIYWILSKFFKKREVWESRSVAVVAIVFGEFSDGVHVLGEKRSEIIRDEPGKWVAPGGYIDWNENGWDAVRRELYEETSFLIEDYSKYLAFTNNKEPFYVETESKECRQNIALNYCLAFDFTLAQKLLPRDIEQFISEEVDMVHWIPVEDIDKYEWAFEHDKRIKMALEKFNILYKKQ